MILYAERLTITITSFTMTHYINTPVWIIVYRCLVLDRNFQYHLNLFTNHVAYGANTFTGATSLSVLADYTALANSYSYRYNSFSPINGTDYSQNKIVTFVSCVGFYGTAPSPIVSVSAYVNNASHFTYDFKFGSAAYVDRYHVNLIVFDQGQM